jgi:hypothetical protein
VATFNSNFVEAIMLADGQTSEVHKCLLELHPRGIITYNYDQAHESALDLRSAQEKENEPWIVILPSEGDKTVELLRSKMKNKFLFKAHGTVDYPSDSMVLTRESFRALFVNPGYRALLQNIFTNYHLLIVGFSLSDPDFDSLLQDVFSVYGSPVQDHVIIMHKNERSARHVIYKLRYGLHFLYVNEFEDIPRVLSDSMNELGSFLNCFADSCLSQDIAIRGRAHMDIRQLSASGKKCLANVFERRIKELISQETVAGYCGSNELSELVYTYGQLVSEDPKYRKFLLEEVIEKSIDSEPVAHALIHLSSALEKHEIPIVERWVARFRPGYFRKDPNNPDPDHRVGVYANYLRVLLRAKYKTWPDLTI